MEREICGRIVLYVPRYCICVETGEVEVREGREIYCVSCIRCVGIERSLSQFLGSISIHSPCFLSSVHLYFHSYFTDFSCIEILFHLSPPSPISALNGAEK